MKGILFFYSPNHCYLSNCFVGSLREFKLKGSFPQNYPQSFSKRRPHFCSDDWYLILEQILLILSPCGYLFSSSKAQNVSVVCLQKCQQGEKICTLSSVHSVKQTYKTAPVELNGMVPSHCTVFALFKVPQQTGRCLQGTSLRGRNGINSFCVVFVGFSIWLHQGISKTMRV